MKCADRFAKNLRRCRRRSGMSQEQVGLRAQLHRTEIGLLERGARVPRIDTLVKVAAALNVNPAELLEGIDWEPGEITVGQFIETDVPGLGIVHRRFEVGREDRA